MSEHAPYDWLPNVVAAEHLELAAAAARLNPKGRTCFRRGPNGTTVEVCDETLAPIMAFNDTFQCPPRC